VRPVGLWRVLPLQAIADHVNDPAQYTPVVNGGPGISVLQYSVSNGDILYLGNGGGQYQAKLELMSGNGDVGISPNGATRARWSRAGQDDVRRRRYRHRRSYHGFQFDAGRRHEGNHERPHYSVMPSLLSQRRILLRAA